jgi:hypothetical protein
MANNRWTVKARTLGAVEQTHIFTAAWCADTK